MVRRPSPHCADMPSHPCAEKGLSLAHIRVFHAIATGLRHGHDPAIVQDLLAHSLVRGGAASYVVPNAIVEQLADWIEWTAGQMDRQEDGTFIYESWKPNTAPNAT
jgi:hypothetical protein